MKRVIYTNDPMKRKYVVAGYIEGLVFYKHCQKNDHYMVKYSGYGIQTDVIPQLKAAGVSLIVVLTKTQRITCSLEDFINFGKDGDTRFTHGRQKFIPVTEPWVTLENIDAQKVG